MMMTGNALPILPDAAQSSIANMLWQQLFPGVPKPQLPTQQVTAPAQMPPVQPNQSQEAVPFMLVQTAPPPPPPPPSVLSTQVSLENPTETEMKKHQTAEQDTPLQRYMKFITCLSSSPNVQLKLICLMCALSSSPNALN